MSHKRTWIDEPLRLMHHHPGYVRAQAGAFVGMSEESPVVSAARKAALDTPGVFGFAHNPRTGSLVIRYQPGETDTDHLLKHMAKKSGLDGVKADLNSTAHRKELIAGFMDTIQEVNGIVSKATGDKADLRELVPFALWAASAAGAILGENRGRVPSWDSALYRGYRIFMQWHREEVRSRERSERDDDKTRERSRG